MPSEVAPSPVSRHEVLSRVKARHDAVMLTLSAKAPEYVANGNGFHNFDRAAATLGHTPEMVLVGFAAKHLVSVLDLVDGIERGQIPPAPMWNEKIGDLITYLNLLDAMVHARRLSPPAVAG